MTINAFAVLAGWADSSMSSAAYTINIPTQLPLSFTIPGLSGVARAIVKDSVSPGCTALPNCLIVGGSFTSAGGVAEVNNIVKIKSDGSFAALGTGMNGLVNALAIDSAGNLYAGGFFTTAGGVPAIKVAKWNEASSSWSALGTPTNPGMSVENSTVLALALDTAGNLYAGGAFRRADRSFVDRISKWDGTSWSSLDDGVDDSVYALAVDSSGNLYAGGDFFTIGDSLVRPFVAKFVTSISSWF